MAAPFIFTVGTPRPRPLRLSTGHLAFCLPDAISGISQENDRGLGCYNLFYRRGRGPRTKQPAGLREADVPGMWVQARFWLQASLAEASRGSGPRTPLAHPREAQTPALPPTPVSGGLTLDTSRTKPHTYHLVDPGGPGDTSSRLHAVRPRPAWTSRPLRPLSLTVSLCSGLHPAGPALQSAPVAGARCPKCKPDLFLPSPLPSWGQRSGP